MSNKIMDASDKETYLLGTSTRGVFVNKFVNAKFGSIKNGLSELLGISFRESFEQLTESESLLDDLSTDYRFCAGSDAVTDFNLLDRNGDRVTPKNGSFFSCIGAFLGYKGLEAYTCGAQLFEKYFQIPNWLMGDRKLQAGLDYIERQYGSQQAAAESFSGGKYYFCPKKTADNWSMTSGYRISDDNSSDFAVIHLTEGAVAPRVCFYSNLAVVCGAHGSNLQEAGWEIVLKDAIGSDSNVEIDLNHLARAQEARKKQDEARQRLRFDANLKAVKDIFKRKMSCAESHEIYVDYISNGRGLDGFNAVRKVNGYNLSSDIFAVKELQYYNQKDHANHKKLFTALLFPLVKNVQGQNKMFALHALYLEQVNGKWVKARVATPKKDLASWSQEKGLSSNLCLFEDSDTLYIGEGNETVSAYFGAVMSEFGQPLGDYKFTNTATRLKSAEIGEYSKVKLLVDRDRSGTGLTACMIKRAELAINGVDVELIMPPSVKLPVYVYLKEQRDATSLDECIAECDFWRGIDKAYLASKNITGVDKLKPRYQSFVVVPDDYEGDMEIYPHMIRVSDIKSDIPKNVDWDDVIKIHPRLAFEMVGVFEYLKKLVA